MLLRVWKNIVCCFKLCIISVLCYECLVWRFANWKSVSTAGGARQAAPRNLVNIEDGYVSIMAQRERSVVGRAHVFSLGRLAKIKFQHNLLS